MRYVVIKKHHHSKSFFCKSPSCFSFIIMTEPIEFRLTKKGSFYITVYITVSIYYYIVFSVIITKSYNYFPAILWIISSLITDASINSYFHSCFCFVNPHYYIDMIVNWKQLLWKSLILFFLFLGTILLL